MGTIKKIHAKGKRLLIRIGIATDFGWFELKLKLIAALKAVGYELTDIGDYELVAGEIYPDFVVPLAKKKSENGKIRNLSQHKNGVMACEAANKIPGVCAALITDSYLNDQEGKYGDYVKCLGGQINGYALSSKKIMTFLNADRSAGIPSNQYLAKVKVLGRTKKMAEEVKYLV